ncbi:MAG: LysR family transcriptional regulator [Pseudomonadota bacterium]
MNWSAVSFDWNQARTFLATAEEGSLSAAARALGQTQPTLGRQVAALEEELGIRLFERVGRGLQLTDAGRSLKNHVAAMRDAAQRVNLAATGHSETVEGRVGVTASAIFSAYHMPAILAELQHRAPKLRIDLIADDALRDIQRREADIAIRHVRPEAPELITRKIAEAEATFVATESYLARRGTPECFDDFRHHDFIAFGDPQEFIQYTDPLGIPLKPENFRLASENSTVGWELVKSGLGISIMDCTVIARSSGMVPILEDKPFRFPIWLTTHRELQTSRKIRLVFDLLAEMIQLTYR